MKIDFKDKKVVIPLIVFLGFIFLTVVYYVNYHEEAVVDETTTQEGMNSEIADVSTLEAATKVDDKFDAYDSYVKENREKLTAMQEVEKEREDTYSKDNYTEEERRRLEQIEDEKRERRLQERLGDNYIPRSYTSSTKGGYKNLSSNDNAESDNSQDPELESLLTAMRNASDTKNSQKSISESDDVKNSPFEDMRKQYLFLDSLQKASDPELIASKKAEQRDRKMQEAMNKNKLTQLKVGKLAYSSKFNTIKRQKDGEFIKAVIDENVTGYAGSRIRIRLLEDITIGRKVLKKNNYLYAIINGFTEQRVKLDIVSVMYDNQILPIKLNVYDIDGLEGLYVPASQFREFTKELGDASVQGMTLSQDSEGQSEFFTSLASRLFTSTSSAISKIIRQNKAKFKYNSFVYLVDEKTLAELNDNIYEQNLKQ